MIRLLKISPNMAHKYYDVLLHGNVVLVEFCIVYSILQNFEVSEF